MSKVQVKTNHPVFGPIEEEGIVIALGEKESLVHVCGIINANVLILNTDFKTNDLPKPDHINLPDGTWESRYLELWRKRVNPCCERARPFQCVCTYNWWCPEHGETHVGTHD
jgi:hypothetical protein